MMKSIINTIISRVVKYVTALHRMGTYLTFDEVVQLVLDELERQNVRMIFDYTDYIKDEINKRLGNKFKK